MRKILLISATCGLIVAAQGCSALEAAGEITLGAETKIPKFSTDIKWPGVDQLLGNALTSATGGDKAPPGLPKSLGSATLAHVQGIMTIDGQCERAVMVPAVASKAADSLIKNLQFNVTNCGDPNRCIEQCQGFRGMKMEARVQFQLLNEKNAKQIKENLSKQTDPAAIVQIRAQFTQLDYYEQKPNGKPGEKVSITKLFSNSEMGLSSSGGGDDTVIVEQRFIGKISKTTPQRFEIDQNAPFTKKTKQAVINGETLWIEIFQRLSIPQQNLYAITLGGGGVDLELQPEFVVSAVKVAKSAL